MFPSAEFLSRPHQPSKEESEAILFFFSFSFSSFSWGEERMRLLVMGMKKRGVFFL